MIIKNLVTQYIIHIFLGVQQLLLVVDLPLWKITVVSWDDEIPNIYMESHNPFMQLLTID